MIDHYTAAPNGPRRTDEERSGPLLELRDLHKTYREGRGVHPVLRGVSLRLGAGEIAFLRGRSGSGKSTLLNVVSGIDVPDRGAVLLDGVDLGRLSERERTRVRRDRIGFVFQFFNLIPTLTVEENLLLPLELQGTRDRAGQERARELLAAVGLADRGGAFPDRLSGGEQQRVAVARALVHRPRLVLADEPTGNLDREIAGIVLDLLARLVRETRATLLIATHSDEGTAMADRILELRDGTLRELPSADAPP